MKDFEYGYKIGDRVRYKVPGDGCRGSKGWHWSSVCIVTWCDVIGGVAFYTLIYENSRCVANDSRMVPEVDIALHISFEVGDRVTCSFYPGNIFKIISFETDDRVNIEHPIKLEYRNVPRSSLTKIDETVNEKEPARKIEVIKEVTMEEIAAKFGVPVSCLRIKN